jgi:hypothetical protein
MVVTVCSCAKRAGDGKHSIDGAELLADAVTSWPFQRVRRSSLCSVFVFHSISSRFVTRAIPRRVVGGPQVDHVAAPVSGAAGQDENKIAALCCTATAGSPCKDRLPGIAEPGSRWISYALGDGRTAALLVAPGPASTRAGRSSRAPHQAAPRFADGSERVRGIPPACSLRCRRSGSE